MQTSLASALAGVRALKGFPPELRARHDRLETLEQKFARWQKVRTPDLALEQHVYNPAWADWFAAERTRIVAALGALAPIVEHFGSTSVPGLSSKNIIDIALGLPAAGDVAAATAALAAACYASWGNSPVDAETLWLWRLLPDRAFVVHLCAHDRPWIGEQAHMRDYLSAHPNERQRYAEVKRQLAAEKGQGLLHYSLRKLAVTVDMVDRAERWRAGLSATAPLQAP